MLVHCPKCGFSQPKDTYCANCGIEMDHFKPIKPPLWKSIVKNPLLPVFLFIGLGYGSYYYLKNQSQNQSQNHFPNSATLTSNKLNQNEVGSDATTTPPTPPTSQESTSPSNTRLDQNTNTMTTTEEHLPLPLDNTTSASNNTNPSRSNDPIAEGTSSSLPLPTESITGPLKVELRFIEAPHTIIQSFLSEASDSASGDTGEMSFGIVKNASAWLNHKSFKELDRLIKNVPETKKKLRWFSGIHEPHNGAPFGFDFQISIQERNGGHLAGDLFISRSMVEHLGKTIATQRKEFTTHFETDVGNLIGLTGLLPRTPYKAEDKDSLMESFLKIFLSPPFLEGETDLLILMQFNSESNKPNQQSQ